MPSKTWIDNIKKRQNCWHIRRVVTLPDGRKHRLDRTLGSCDTVNKVQAMDKAIKIVQKVEEIGLEALKKFERSYAGIGHNKMSVGALIEEYIHLGKTTGTQKSKFRPWRKSSIKVFEADLKGRWEELLHFSIDSIDPEYIKGWYLRHFEEYKSATQNAFRRLNTVFDYAIGEGYIQSNPCTMMNKSKRRYVVPKKERALDVKKNEIGKFAKALIEHRPVQRKKMDSTTRDAIATMFFTGRRKTEIFELRWSWFSDTKDFRSFIVPAEAQYEFFEGSKSHSDYYIACCSFLQEMFERRYENRHHLCEILGHSGAMEFVFPCRDRKDKGLTDIDGRLKLILDSAGLPWYSPHDYKRTFTNIVGFSELPDRIIKYITQHKDNDITFDRYMKERNILHIHQGFQFVEDYISKSIPMTFDTIDGQESFSGTQEVSKDNKSLIDRTGAKEDYFRLAYSRHPIFGVAPADKMPDKIKQKRKQVRTTYKTKDIHPEYDNVVHQGSKAFLSIRMARETMNKFLEEDVDKKRFEVLKRVGSDLVQEAYLLFNTKLNDKIFRLNKNKDANGFLGHPICQGEIVQIRMLRKTIASVLKLKKEIDDFSFIKAKNKEVKLTTQIYDLDNRDETNKLRLNPIPLKYRKIIKKNKGKFPLKDKKEFQAELIKENTVEVKKLLEEVKDYL